jgi:hypothetical protein
MKSFVPTEAEVQKSCLAILAARGVLAWRSNSRVFRVPGVGGRERLMRAGLGKASADLIGILPDGRFVAVECKREGEKPTAEQVAWLTRVNLQGGLAFWVDHSWRIEQVLMHYEAARRVGRSLVVEILGDGTISLDYGKVKPS